MQAVPARGHPLPDPVLLQLVAGLAPSRVVCFIVVLLWPLGPARSSFRGGPLGRRLQVAAAVARLPAVIHRRGHRQLLHHFGHPNKTAISFQGSPGTLQPSASVTTKSGETTRWDASTRLGARTLAVHVLNTRQTPRLLRGGSRQLRPSGAHQVA